MGGAPSQRAPGANTNTVSQMTPPLLNSPAGHPECFRAASRSAEDVSCPPSQNWAARTSEMRESTLLGGAFVAAGATRERPTRSQTTSTATFLSLWCRSRLASAEAPRTQLSHEGESKASIQAPARG